MEFLNGGSLLWNLKKQKYFNEETVCFYSAQILCGILFLHSKQIIHQDIKLENVLLDSNGNAKLCDFTLCLKINENISEKTEREECGTLPYRSPESFKLEYTDYSIDFWSFGICIYTMFTNNFPFQNEESIRDLNIKIPIINKPMPIMSNKFHFCLKYSL
jgi:serine/threonine protein kinase